MALARLFLIVKLMRNELFGRLKLTDGANAGEYSQPVG